MFYSALKPITLACLASLIASQAGFATTSAEPVVLLQAHSAKPSTLQIENSAAVADPAGQPAADQQMPSSPVSVDAGAAEASSAGDSTLARKALKATVSKVAAPVIKPEDMVEHLVHIAQSNQALTHDIESKQKKYRGKVRRSVARVADMAQFATAYRGFQISSEVADVVLNEKLKLKSKAAVEYAQQKQYDELHVKVVESLMQLAQGYGMPDAARRARAVRSGREQLEQLVGEDEARKCVSDFKAWALTARDPQILAHQEPFDIVHLQDHTDRLLMSALKIDPCVAEVRDRLHKYNHHSTVMRATAKVVNTTLSALMFSPTVISPAAQIALMAFLMATGGPEEAKLLKELYLDQRIESRYAMLNREAALAVNNYNMGVLTRNPVLVAYCKLAAEQLSGKEPAAQILTDDGLVTASKGSKIEVSQKKPGANTN